MEERFVQYREREGIELAADSATVSPAPMVVRAFRLLDLLSMSEEGLTLSELSRKLQSEHPLPHISVPLGTRIPLLTGAMGRLVLASWTVEQRRAFLRTHSLPRLTKHSIMDPEQFLASVEETARTGIDMCHEEYLTGVNIVAVPITGPTGLPVALLCVFGFVSQFDDDAMRRAGQQLQAGAEAISRLLETR